MTTITQVSEERFARLIETKRGNRISRFIKQLFCSHKKRLMEWSDYHDRTVHTVCLKCGKHIYEEI